MIGGRYAEAKYDFYIDHDPLKANDVEFQNQKSSDAYEDNGKYATGGRDENRGYYNNNYHNKNTGGSYYKQHSNYYGGQNHYKPNYGAKYYGDRDTGGGSKNYQDRDSYQ